jgi:sterol 14-demethylase
MIKKLLATKKIYDIVAKAIKDREQSGVHHNDTLQMLLDSGDDRLVVVGVSGVYSSRLDFPRY